ncbi:FecR family protein [Flavivirga eckloniae]|uniref:Iron dicitrate transport regulator FecR n=1 Tax=Flavivirga eckloniae TaxID=1803846 RepID=A0A2K9PUG1_9FLAO|nr:FecR family protein [Flavivirga eckloniae]AUP80706.1 iron dicitrate transport regulator FecR [Flavivirga eckloniae]
METKKIIKYIKGIASGEEAIEVQRWINASQENAQKFNLLKAEHIASTFDETSRSANANKSYNNYRARIDKSSRNQKRTLWSKTLKYAAMVAVILSAAYLYNKGGFKANEVPIPKDAIVLELDNGAIKIINEASSAKFVDAKGNTIGTQKGSKLEYNNNSPESEKLVYNTLRVPYGKRFDIVLSDNTLVTLNAGTSLKYPVKFIKGQKREVFINGEALFNVAKDEAHPFVVNAKDINVRVLGTVFNVSSYPEDLNAKTVLVEGSVSLYQEENYQPDKAVLLKPGQMASLNKSEQSMSVKEVDVSLYTAWTNGTISFKHEPFKNIIKQLERHYDVVIHCNNKELNQTFYTASFNNVSLEYILQTFKNIYDIKYTIEKPTNKKIITINQ